MKLVLISDTHEQHAQVTIPPCDVLVHAGDLTYRGSRQKTRDALEWLDRQPAKYVVFIAGNHDFFFKDYPSAAVDLLSDYPKLRYLNESGTEIDGVRFWGSPYTPKFFDWAFMYDRVDGEKLWGKIPYNLEVLITHGPPCGILDQAYPQKGSLHCGCSDLYDAVRAVGPRIHVFGHIHGGYGSQATVGTDWQVKPVYYNASVVNEDYRVVNKPWEVTL